MTFKSLENADSLDFCLLSDCTYADIARFLPPI